MKKLFFVFLALFSALDAQVSSLDIENIKNQQLDLIREEMKALQTTSVDTSTDTDFKEVTVISSPSKKAISEFFGYEYLLNDVSFVDFPESVSLGFHSHHKEVDRDVLAL